MMVDVIGWVGWEESKLFAEQDSGLRAAKQILHAGCEQQGGLGAPKMVPGLAQGPPNKGGHNLLTPAKGEQCCTEPSSL